MATFAFLCCGWEGFLSICVMSTVGLLKVLPFGKGGFERLCIIPGTATLGRKTDLAEGRFEALWPLHGTGPPAKGP
jgi:hypothetical protein